MDLLDAVAGRSPILSVYAADRSGQNAFVAEQLDPFESSLTLKNRGHQYD